MNGGPLRKFFMLDTRGVKVCYSTSFYLRSRKKIHLFLFAALQKYIAIVTANSLEICPSHKK